MKKFLIVDDHDVVRSGIKGLLIACIVLKLVDSFTRYTQSDKIAMYCVLSLVVHL